MDSLFGSKHVKFKDQSYSKIVKECKKHNHLFEDPTFPCNATSLNHPEGQVDGWKRPGELCGDPHLFVEGVEPGDVLQGALGDCWFVSACAILSLHPKLIKQVIPKSKEQEWHKDNHYTGAFLFRFWVMGEWVDVVIDDRLPTRRGSLVYVTCKDSNEFWAPLLEKAYAKLYGSYGILQGGHTGDALEDFTGGLVESVDFQARAKEDEKFYKYLKKEHQDGAMMACSMDTGGGLEASAGMGLVNLHAYAVLNVRSAHTKGLPGFRDSHHLLQLRNPWGAKEWTGAWSDGSKEWTAIPDKEKKKLGYSDKEDGSFFMDFDAVCEHFNSFIIFRIINTALLTVKKTWHDKEFHGEWRAGTNDGGCINHGKEKFLTNPQYTFAIKEQQQVIVALMQTDRRNLSDRNGEKGSNYSIGFAVYKVEENRTVRLTEFGHSVASSYAAKREVVENLELGPGRYVVFPTTFDPGFHTKYLLRLYSETSSHAYELTKARPDGNSIRGRKGGVLRVKVKSAQGLPKMDLTGPGADPYVEVKVEGVTSKTPIVFKNRSPVWDSEHVFYVAKPDEATISLKCYDHDDMSMDDFIGSATLQVADYTTAQRESKGWNETVHLRNEKSKKRPDGGELQLTIRYNDGLDHC